MANIVSESGRDRAFRALEQDTSRQSIAEELPAHDAEMTSSSKDQYRLGKRVDRVRYDRYVACQEKLPETTPPRGTGDPYGKETRGFAKARQTSQSGSGATAFLRARPVDPSRAIPASEFVSAGRRFLGPDGGVPGDEVPPLSCDGRKHVACATVLSIGFAGQLAPAPGPRALIRHQVESGAPFNADRNLRMDMVIERGGLRDAMASEYRSIATKRHSNCSTSRIQTHTRWATCLQAALTEMVWLLLNPRRASAATTLGRDKFLRRAQLQTHHPRGGKLWAPR